MIKLKVGKNYLISTNVNSAEMNDILYPLTFMSAFLKGENIICIDCVSPRNQEMNDGLAALCRYILQANLLDIVLLTYAPLIKTPQRKVVLDANYSKDIVQYMTRHLEQENPLIKIKVILVNKYQRNPLFKLTYNMLTGLCKDKRWLLYHLKDLPIYKEFITRSQEIPKEIDVIDNEIKKLTNKKTDIFKGNITMERLNKIKLVKNVVINEMDELQLTVMPLHITPSLQLGKVYGEDTIGSIKYLYEAIKHYYLGYKFYMCETIVTVDRNFKPKIIRAVDVRYERLLDNIGWAGTGYCHIGYRSYCYGEFADVIAKAKECGLEYYFIGLKQYLTTANVLDSAGDNIWAWPLVDENNNIVYSAVLDRTRDYLLNNSEAPTLSPDIKEKIKEMSFDELLTFLHQKGWNCYQLRGYLPGPETISYRNSGKDNFLAICKQREPEVYEQIIKRGEIKDAN